MIKVSFEGQSVAELTDSVSDFLNSLNGGASVAQAANTRGAKNATIATPAAPKLSDVQNALVGVKGKKAEKVALLTKYMCTDLDGLDESDYQAFIDDLGKL